MAAGLAAGRSLVLQHPGGRFACATGLKPVGLRPNGQFVYACANGAFIVLFPKEGGAKAEDTALSFRVQNIGSLISALEKAGVAFEDYDLAGLKTVNHVCALGAEKAAWFKDTEGNLLCIHEDAA